MSQSQTFLRDAGAASVQCTSCEYLVDAVDAAIHAEKASNRTLDLGWRLRNDGRREVSTVPAWDSNVGFIDIVDGVCSEAELGLRGLRPMTPAKGEAQWQLVHVNSSAYTGQDSGYRGYMLLVHPSHDGASGNLEAAQDLLRDYIEGCRAVAEVHDEVLQEVLRGAKRSQSAPSSWASEGAGWSWSTSPDAWRLKQELCVKRTQLCAGGRRWSALSESNELITWRLRAHIAAVAPTERGGKRGAEEL
jgi:hypothetical protein